MVHVAGEDYGVVYKVCHRLDWDAACAAGEYAGSSDDLRDGFIHFSTWSQLDGTLAKHFVGQSDLMLIAFRSDALGDALKWEASRGGELFPHVYGVLQPKLAVGTWPLELDAAGTPRAPQVAKIGEAE